jgi:outer membrane biosynthesis protein TonB
LGQKDEVTVEFTRLDGVSVVGSLPIPKYPDESRRALIGGKVSVRVNVLANGTVAVDGEPMGPYPICHAVMNPPVRLLRRVARDAATKAKFTNSTGSNVQSLIIYTFPRPKVAVEVVPARVVGDPPEKETKYVPWSNSSGGVAAANDPPTLTMRESDKTKTVIGDSDVDSGAGSNTKLPKAVPGGVLNGKALLLAKPAFPAAAKAVRATGSVSVQVLVAEDGTVFSAEAISGHPLLRAASEGAACSSRFSPTLLSGQPVKVSGVITYNFVP